MLLPILCSCYSSRARTFRNLYSFEGGGLQGMMTSDMDRVGCQKILDDQK